jgi:hypothetical protein
MLHLIVPNEKPTLKKPEALSRDPKSFLSVWMCVDVKSRATAAKLLDVSRFSSFECAWEPASDSFIARVPAQGMPAAERPRTFAQDKFQRDRCMRH